MSSRCDCCCGHDSARDDTSPLIIPAGRVRAERPQRGGFHSWSSVGKSTKAKARVKKEASRMLLSPADALGLTDCSEHEPTRRAGPS